MSGPGPMRSMVFEPPPPDVQPRSNGEATAPDDDMLWRDANRTRAQAGLDPAARDAALLAQCEERLERAWAPGKQPAKIAAAVEANSCTALKGSGKQCSKCRICPREQMWEDVAGYYRANKGKIFICADKEPSLEQVEATLSQELIHAFDHCRLGMRVPMVGWQAPWALGCAATACSEVRAYLTSSLRHARAGGSAVGGASGGLDGLGGLGGGSFGNDGVYGGGGDAGGNSFGGDGVSGGGGTHGGFGDGGGGGGFGGDGGFGGGGGGFGGLAAGGASAVTDERVRQEVYGAAFTSLSGWGRCREEGREPRAVLDAIFNACMADRAPLQPSRVGGPAFPPMPPEVDSAEKSVGVGRPQPPAGGLFGGGGGGATTPVQPAETHKDKWGEA